MEPRNVIVWTLLIVLVVLVMSADVQAQELREVPASEILEKIQAGEDVNYTNVRVTGEFDLSEIDLETVPIAREEFEIVLGLEKELNIVESKVTIINSVFGNVTDFSNMQFKKPVDFRGTSFLDISDFSGARFGADADFGLQVLTVLPTSRMRLLMMMSASGVRVLVVMLTSCLRVLTVMPTSVYRI